MKIRVLPVDDSEVYRSLLRRLLENEPDVEIVSQASNGRLALPRIRHYQPDIVLLDHEMPELDGLSAIPEIKKISPQSRIIMFSAHTTRAAQLTLKALERGADDFITKPGGTPPTEEFATLRQDLLSRMRALAGQHKNRAFSFPAPPIKKTARAPKHLQYCLIGISTGGPNALRRLLCQIPATISGSIFIVQHMPPVFTAQLAQSLDAECALTVVEACDGIEPQPATAYIAPGGRQMRLVADDAKVHIRIEDGNPDELCKPSANILFQSAAICCAEKTLAIIMTGMGDDGYLGMQKLAARGAYLMAQEASDCTIFGMPAKPIRDGIIHEIHTAEKLGLRIAEFLQ